MEKCKGLPGAAGQAIGKLVRLEKKECVVERRTVASPEQEIVRFRKIQREYSEELDSLYETTLKGMGKDSAEIFRAYQMIANDEYFFGNAIKRVQTEKINMDYAIEEEKKKICEMFSSMSDAYMKERAADIENVCNELINKLNGIVSVESQIGMMDEPFIVVAEDLTPADTVRIEKTFLKGFITEKGGVTSHVVILAKTLGIPAIVGAKDVLGLTKDKELIYINGADGYAIVEPDQEFVDKFLIEKEKIDALEAHFAQMARKEVSTLDGRKIRVCVNSGDSDSLETFCADACDGIGLFRTEFLYMNEREYPTEEKQFRVYKSIAEKACGKEVIIRTLDIGGDKQLDYMELPKEENPFLGYRAIRICLDRKEVFRTQLRAIFRASAFGKIKVMFPMIVTVEELRQAKQVVEEVKEELRKEGKAFQEDTPVGIMIETPASVLISEKLAEEADFFSIGTNDLIQYMTATDRMNERVQYLYTPLNLSVLAAIGMVIQNGHLHGLPVGMCGEAASDERMIPILLGMGLDEFSVVPSQVGRVKSFISCLSYEYAQKFVPNVLGKQTIQEAEDMLLRFNRSVKLGEGT